MTPVTRRSLYGSRPVAERLQNIIRNGLTPRQRQVITAIYFENKTISQLARELGRNRSTICRTLHRAEDRIQRYLSF